MRLKISYQITIGGAVIEHDLSIEPRSVSITPATAPESFPGLGAFPADYSDRLAPPFRVNIKQRGDAEDLAWLVLPTAEFRLDLSDDQEGSEQ